MPKFFIPLESLDREDFSETGQKLANFSILKQNGARLPQGFVIPPESLRVLLEEFYPQIIVAAGNQNKTTNKVSFFNDLRNLVLKNFKIEGELATKLSSASKTLDFPITINAFTLKKNKNELITFEAVIFSNSEFLPTLKTALISFLNPIVLDEVTLSSLTDLSIAVSVCEKPAAEVSGKVVYSKEKQRKLRIFSQWGEFHPNWTSDLSLFDLDSQKEEENNVALQEKQVLLKGSKYISIPVAKNFQFARKLENPDIQKLVSLAKKISNQIVSDFEFKFVISDGKLLITELTTNQSLSHDTTPLPLIDYLNLYKQIRPIVGGIRTGPLHKIVTKKDLKKIRTGEIAALRYFDKKVLPSLKKASGIIIETSTSLTQEQIQAIKHYGKTALSGNLEGIRNKVVTIDGRTGKVYIGAFRPPYTKTLLPTENAAAEIETKHATAIFSKISAHNQINDLVTDSSLGYTLHYQTNIEKLLLQLGQEHKTTILTTDEAHLEEALHLVKRLRHSHGLTSLQLCLPSITTINQFSLLKKKVSAVGLHRGGSFKLFAAISNPASALGFAEILESNIDGVIIDYFALVNTTYGKEFSLTEINALEDSSISILLNQVLNLSNRHNVYTLVQNLPVAKQTSVLEDLIAKGLKGVIVEPSNLKESRLTLSKIEKDLFSNRQ